MDGFERNPRSQSAGCSGVIHFTILRIISISIDDYQVPQSKLSPPNAGQKKQIPKMKNMTDN